MSTTRIAAALLTLGALSPAAGAAAQLGLTADAGLLSAYEWRGVTYTNRFVIQPEATLTLPLAHGAVELGGWGNFEPREYTGEHDIRSGGELVGPAVTQWSAWGEYAHEAGPAELAAGAMAYLYPQSTGFTEDWNTVEVYGRLAVEGPLSPELSAWYDVGRVRGAYLEGSLSHTLRVAHLPLSFRGIAGYSAGQGERADGRDAAYFEGNGLTHLEVEVAAEMELGTLSMQPTLHLVLPRDGYARAGAHEETESRKLWFGVNLGWTREVEARR